MGRPQQQYADWSLSNAQLSADYGYAESTIKSCRRRLAPETLSRFRVAKSVDWDKVDFSESLTKVCAKTGCEKRTVLQMKARRLRGGT